MYPVKHWWTFSPFPTFSIFFYIFFFWSRSWARAWNLFKTTSGTQLRISKAWPQPRSTATSNKFGFAGLHTVQSKIKCIACGGWPTVSQAYFALHETLHIFKKCWRKNIFWYKVSSEAFFTHFPKFEGHTSSGLHTNETLNLLTKLWSFKVIKTFFRARSWLCCAPVVGLTKSVAKQNV